MGTGFEVQPESLRKHSSEVQDLAGRVDGAAQAAHHLASLDDAYGLICQQLGLPEMLRLPQEIAARTIDNLRDSLRATSENVNRAADEYQQTDMEHGRQLNRLGDRLDSADKPPTLGAGQAGESNYG